MERSTRPTRRRRVQLRDISKPLLNSRQGYIRSNSPIPSAPRCTLKPSRWSTGVLLHEWLSPRSRVRCLFLWFEATPQIALAFFNNIFARYKAHLGCSRLWFFEIWGYRITDGQQRRVFALDEVQCSQYNTYAFNSIEDAHD
jgi:hypothetical protein